jgi:hypothetical protein
VRPAIRDLLAQVANPDAQAATAALILDAFTERREEVASDALWAAVDRAEARGLLEIFGAEYFGLRDASYAAVVFVRTREGSACLYADGELHDRRDAGRGVPAVTVAAEEFGWLRDRIGVHLPGRSRLRTSRR